MQTPRYEYSRSMLEGKATEVMSLSAPYGLRIGYAMKANPHPEIIQIFDDAGLVFDCSSSYEAEDLLALGVKGNRISLSSQQSAHDLPGLIKAGVRYTATSINQLKQFISLPRRNKKVGLRINPGIGSGHSNRVSTGGENASFGLWHEYIDQALELATSRKVKIDLVHIHIGSGTDPKVWAQVAHDALEYVDKLPDVTTLNMGGGFKTGYQPGEADVDMQAIIQAVSDKLEDFESDTGRKIQLEIEPGRYMVVHAGILIAHVDDIVDTGADGYKFVRLNTGMNDFLRSPMYGSYHKIEIINDSKETENYVVVGHNCESADLFTPVVGNPEEIASRTLSRANIGDEVRIYDTGAYCASMRAKGYNSFPDAEELMVD